jgi:hypothetical protein
MSSHGTRCRRWVELWPHVHGIDCDRRQVLPQVGGLMVREYGHRSRKSEAVNLSSDCIMTVELCGVHLEFTSRAPSGPKKSVFP